MPASLAHRCAMTPVRLAAACLLLGAPLAAGAQPSQQVHRIAFVGSGQPGLGIDVFRAEMRQLGYVEGKNLVIDIRFPGDRPERIPALVSEVIALKADVIVAGSTPAALAAKKATTRIPVVFASLFDPVGSGVVPSLGHPGGNITGVAIGIGGSGMAGKWIELLKEAVPAASRVAALSNPANPASMASVREIESAARSLKVTLDVMKAASAADLDAALAAIAESRPQGIIVTNDPYFTAQRARLIEFAARARVPAVYFFRTFSEAGGLMSYGANQADAYRRAAAYVDKILKGAKPGDLPVDQPTRFELVVNLKTAKALGLKLPQSLLVRADEIIQ